MKHKFLLIVIAGTMWGCLENRNPEPERDQPSINENIPLNEREMLMGPIEGALDDLKDVLVNDESFFNPYDEWNDNGIKGSIDSKLDGEDTVMVLLKMSNAVGLKETHQWFYDKDHYSFYSEHLFMNEQSGVEGMQSSKAYKFYFEDKGVLLSVYGKQSFGEALPETWTPICPTREEEIYLKTRLIYARKALAKTRQISE
jgi:hypothetical protein